MGRTDRSGDESDADDGHQHSHVSNHRRTFAETNTGRGRNHRTHHRGGGRDHCHRPLGEREVEHRQADEPSDASGGAPQPVPTRCNGVGQHDQCDTQNENTEDLSDEGDGETVRLARGPSPTKIAQPVHTCGRGGQHDLHASWLAEVRCRGEDLWWGSCNTFDSVAPGCECPVCAWAP